MYHRTFNLVAAAAVLYAIPTLAQDNCPSGQVQYFTNNSSYCCPGTVFGENNDKFCCVGANFDVATPSFSSCFPFCSGSNNGETVVSTSTQSCATSIYFTNSDYSSLAQAAASSIGISTASGSGSGNGGSGASDTTITGFGASTTGSSSTSNSGSGASSTSSQISSKGSSSESSSSVSGESTAGAAMITSGPVFGGLVAAGGLIMAL